MGLVERRGQPQADGWLIPLELGTEDIASLLGSTRQTVSQLLNQWTRDGILSPPRSAATVGALAPGAGKSVSQLTDAHRAPALRCGHPLFAGGDAR
ncbi:MAG: helix-turn-helix domain-containing protein [Rivihabitans pingtungensis]